MLSSNGATTLIDQTYARNSKGLITAITSPDAGRAWTYGYDLLDRLITADNANGTADDRTFAYDDADNMVFDSRALCRQSQPGVSGLGCAAAASAQPGQPDRYLCGPDGGDLDSIVAASYPPANAVDISLPSSASVLGPSNDGWFQLDMGGSFQVSRVQPTSGSNAWASTLTGAVVSLRDAAGATLYSFPVLAGAPGWSLRWIFRRRSLPAVFMFASPNGGGIAEIDVFNQPPAPPPPVAVARPHAPTSICGTPVTYDANGNTTSYDADGAGSIQPRAFTYDGENRPLTITQNANVTSFAYAPDGERAGKAFGGNTTSFLGNDTELLVNAANPTGLLTSTLHPDVKREGFITSWAHKDHLASNRLVSFMAGGQATTRHDYGPFGNPLTSNGSTVLNGKAYINERFDAETGLQYLLPRQILRSQPRPLPHPRHLGSDPRGRRLQPICLRR